MFIQPEGHRPMRQHHMNTHNYIHAAVILQAYIVRNTEINTTNYQND